MDDTEYGKSVCKDEIIKIYSDFMTRITQFEELVPIGSRLLGGFQQALGFLRRPPIDKTSTLVESIIKAHGSKRVLSYVEAGCVNSHESVQNLSKCYAEVHTCHLGLQDHINKAKIVVDELENLVDDAASVLQTAKEKDRVDNCELDCLITSIDEEELPLSNISKPEVTDYAIMMAIVYSMVKQDYAMQVRTVSSLNLKSSSEELETYCQMWSLRPFVDDEKMHRAWSLVPMS